MGLTADPYFAAAESLELSDDQKYVLSRVRRVLDSVAPAYAKPADSTALLDEDGDLRLTLPHTQDADVRLELRVDRGGFLDVRSEAQHPEFSICFNDREDIHDQFGDLDCAEEVLSGLISGRVTSRVLWRGDEVAGSRNVLLREDGSKLLLSDEASLGPLLGTFFFGGSGRRTVSRVSFVEPR